MTLGRGEWLLGGATILTFLSAWLVMDYVPGVLRPGPVHQIVLAELMGGAYVLVLPAIYLVTLAGLWGTRWLAPVSLAASLVVAGLSVAWFVSSWEFADTYQSVEHAIAVAALNAVVIVVATVLALVGWRRQSRQTQASAYFTVFAILSWCAFPYISAL